MSSAAKRAVVAGELHKIVKRYGVVDGKNRKIYKSYAVVGGVNRLIYMSENFAFTGAYAVSLVEIDSTKYELYKLTTSGILSIYADDALFWMCGGGAGGESSKIGLSAGHRSGNAGGGGAGAFCASGDLPTGKYPVEIGAGGTADNDGLATTLGEYAAAGGKAGKGGTGGIGGTGGGGAASGDYSGARNGQGGAGDGVNKYPFGLSSLGAHCAGGGGGSLNYSNSYADIKGGDGGTNGNHGNTSGTSSSSSGVAIGGEKGGGSGGSFVQDGKDATFYGSAGGGAGVSLTGQANTYKGGSGYQGVVYIAIPHKQEPLIIIRQPENVTATSGASFTFAVDATGVATYQWQYSSNGSEFYDLPANDKWTSATTDTLEVAVDEYSITWYYRCKLTGTDGSVLHTNVVKFTSPIIITKQPENQVAVGGDTVTFHVEALGAVSYQWQSTSNNGLSWSNLSWEGAKTATMTRTLNINTATYKYRCMLKAAGGTVVYTDIVGFTSP